MLCLRSHLSTCPPASSPLEIRHRGSWSGISSGRSSHAAARACESGSLLKRTAGYCPTHSAEQRRAAKRIFCLGTPSYESPKSDRLVGKGQDDGGEADVEPETEKGPTFQQYSAPTAYQSPSYAAPTANMSATYGPGDGGSGRDGDGFGGNGGGPSGGGHDEQPAKKLSPSQILTAVYAAILIGGGLAGFASKGSVKSLLSSLLASAVLLRVFLLLPVDPRAGSILGVGVSALLLLVMSVRFSKSQKFMPAGLVALLSLIMTGGYIHGIQKSLH